MRPDVLAFVKFNQGTICVIQFLVHHEQSYMMRRFLFIYYDTISQFAQGRKQIKRCTRCRTRNMLIYAHLINRVARKNLTSAVIAMPRR